MVNMTKMNLKQILFFKIKTEFDIYNKMIEIFKKIKVSKILKNK